MLSDDANGHYLYNITIITTYNEYRTYIGVRLFHVKFRILETVLLQRRHFQLVRNVQGGAHNVYVTRQHGRQPGQPGHDVRVQRVQSVQIVDEQDQRRGPIFVLEPFQQRLEPIADVQRVERRIQGHAQTVRLKYVGQLLADDPQQLQVVRGPGRDAREPHNSRRLLVEPSLALLVDGGQDRRLARPQAAAHDDRPVFGGRRHHFPYLVHRFQPRVGRAERDQVSAVRYVHDRLLQHFLYSFVPGVQLGPLLYARVYHALHLRHDRLLEYRQVHVVLGMFAVDTSGFPFHAVNRILK